jgi:hypothetical protein
MQSMKAWAILNSSKLIQANESWNIELYYTRADALKKLGRGQTIAKVEIKVIPNFTDSVGLL